MKLLAIILSLLGLTMLGAAIFQPTRQEPKVVESSHVVVLNEPDQHLVKLVERAVVPALFVSCGTNPYLATGPYGTHTPPAMPECGEGKHLDDACKTACKVPYLYDLDNALINAFALWNNKCAAYQACRAACASGDLMCKNICDAQWSADQIAIFRAFIKSESDADAAYLECLAGCCVNDQ